MNHLLLFCCLIHQLQFYEVTCVCYESLACESLAGCSHQNIGMTRVSLRLFSWSPVTESNQTLSESTRQQTSRVKETPQMSKRCLENIHLFWTLRFTRRGRGLGAAIKSLFKIVMLGNCYAAVVQLLCNCSSVSNNKSPQTPRSFHTTLGCYSHFNNGALIVIFRVVCVTIRPETNNQSPQSVFQATQIKIKRSVCRSALHTITQYLRLRIKIPAGRCFPAESWAETDAVWER